MEFRKITSWFRLNRNRLLAGVMTGGLLGFGYYHFFGCNQSCAITGNPVNSTLYGVFLGLVILWPGRRNQKPE